MTLNILGINHNTAPVQIREQVVIEPAAVPDALRSLCGMPGVTEAVLVSTCNRTEVYWCGEPGQRDAVTGWLEASEHTGTGFRDSLFSLTDREAAEHLFRVTCGLDSMVLGETQITGQLKDAYRLAQQLPTVGPELTRVFQQAFSIAKKVRTDTQIGASPVSVAYAAVSLARRLFSGFDRHTALLVGAGETIELVARHLKSQNLGRLFIANRSEERARLLADQFEGIALPLDRLDQALPDADILISSTASPQPVVTLEAMQRAMKARRRKPVFVVDIAVPRDIDAAVSTLSDVYLYTIDDLHNVVTDGLQTRREASLEAEKIIREELDRFSHAERTREAAPTIREVRNSATAIRDELLAVAQRRIAAGHPPEEVLKKLAHSLTQKLLHQPTERLREAAAEADSDTIGIARELFLGREDESGGGEGGLENVAEIAPGTAFRRTGTDGESAD